MNTFIIIPAYNAAGKIAEVLQKLLPLGHEIVVVDDGSEDQTFALAHKYTPHVLRHILNRGQGAALMTGHEYAKTLGADIVVHFDADDQHNPSDIPYGIAQLSRNTVDIVLGSRFLGKKPPEHLFEQLQLQGKRLVDQLFSGISLTDTHNGFRVLSRKALDCIVLTQDRMAHATEIISEIRRHQLKYIEIPVTIQYTEYSRNQSSNKNFLRSSLRIVKELILGKITRF